MFQTNISKAGYFLVGVGIGSIIAVLYAPKSGRKTREYLSRKVREGGMYAEEKARELKRELEIVVQRSEEAVRHKQEQIATAIDVGREAYRREKARA